METSNAFLAFMAGFAIFGVGIFMLGHRRLRAIGREIDLNDPRQSKSVEHWRRIRGGGVFLLIFCSALLYAGLHARLEPAQTGHKQDAEAQEPPAPPTE